MYNVYVVIYHWNKCSKIEKSFWINEREDNLTEESYIIIVHFVDFYKILI